MKLKFKFDPLHLDLQSSLTFSDSLHGELILFKLKNGELKLVSGYCPHFGGPLDFNGENLICPWHDYRFEIESLSVCNKKGNLSVKQLKIISLDIIHGCIEYEAL